MLDRSVGRLMNLTAELSIDESTLMIFSADSMINLMILLLRILSMLAAAAFERHCLTTVQLLFPPECSTDLPQMAVRGIGAPTSAVLMASSEVASSRQCDKIHLTVPPLFI
eukprot:SAG11_NODE_505_length_8888_cov_12.479235_9_plen_111_part_00